VNALAEEPDLHLFIERIENGEGTLEEREEWLARVEALDPYFWDSDRMSSLARAVMLARRVQILREELGSPLDREQLVALVESIDYSKAASLEDIDALDARSMLFASSVPHPDAGGLVNHVWFDRGMSAEAAVDAALAFKVSAPFYLPGPVDEV